MQSWGATGCDFSRSCLFSCPNPPALGLDVFLSQAPGCGRVAGGREPSLGLLKVFPAQLGRTRQLAPRVSPPQPLPPGLRADCQPQGGEPGSSSARAPRVWVRAWGGDVASSAAAHAVGGRAQPAAELPPDLLRLPPRRWSCRRRALFSSFPRGTSLWGPGVGVGDLTGICPLTDHHGKGEDDYICAFDKMKMLGLRCLN